MRRKTFWIPLLTLAAAGLLALHARAVSPPANLDDAIAGQRQLAVESPGDPQILNDLGNLLLLAGDHDLAETAYRDALAIDPEMTSARYNLALLLAQTERRGEALDELKTVLEMEPENAWAHYQVGAILDARGSERRAIRRYATAFRLDPQLAFPEVNAHVIDNEHLTSAMLMAYKDLPLTAQAPKTYERPGRVVDLLVPSPADPSDVEALTQGTEGAEPAGDAVPRTTWAPGAAGVAGEGEAAGGPGEGGGRVLREGDLERGGTVNQIVTPGYQRAPRGGTRVPPVRTYTPPGRATQNDGRGTGAGQVGTGQGSRQRFTPGIPSTGRLELELFPVEDGEDGGGRATLAAAG